MSRKQFDIWDWGAEDRLEMATGSHKHGRDDRAIGVGKISQGEDLGQNRNTSIWGVGSGRRASKEQNR